MKACRLASVSGISWVCCTPSTPRQNAQRLATRGDHDKRGHRGRTTATSGRHCHANDNASTDVDDHETPKALTYVLQHTNCNSKTREGAPAVRRTASTAARATQARHTTTTAVAAAQNLCAAARRCAAAKHPPNEVTNNGATPATRVQQRTAATRRHAGRVCARQRDTSGRPGGARTSLKIRSFPRSAFPRKYSARPRKFTPAPMTNVTNFIVEPEAG
jgi:hypothetical protein